MSEKDLLNNTDGEEEFETPEVINIIIDDDEQEPIVMSETAKPEEAPKTSENAGAPETSESAEAPEKPEVSESPDEKEAVDDDENEIVIESLLEEPSESAGSPESEGNPPNGDSNPPKSEDESSEAESPKTEQENDDAESPKPEEENESREAESSNPEEESSDAESLNPEEESSDAESLNPEEESGDAESLNPEDEKENSEAESPNPEDEKESKESESPNPDEEKESTDTDSPEEQQEEPTGKKKKRGIFARIISVIEWILLLAAAGLLAYIFVCTARGKAATVFGYNVLHVVTGSMEPTISEDDYILVQKTDIAGLEPDDIIAYYSEDPEIRGKLVIHRIIEIHEDGTFVTKGDANPISDKYAVRPDQVLGKYKKRIWLLSWISSFVSPQKLLLLAVIIPMFLASIYEVTTITKLIKKGKKEKAKENAEAAETGAGTDDRKPVKAKKKSKKKSGGDQETEEEKIERWKREAIEEYRRTHPDGE